MLDQNGLGLSIECIHTRRERQFQDHHWTINKKEAKPQKLYVINEETILSCGNVIMTFQKINEDQLEIVKDTTPMTRRQNISDLLAESKE